jgi:hypothetical protein
MSYLTLEVETGHGKVVAKEPSMLPEKAAGLLTIIQAEGGTAFPMSQLEALDALQANLNLDDNKAADWMAAVRDARR